MAEVHEPGDTPAEDGRRVERPADRTTTGGPTGRVIDPPTADELSASGEPSAAEIHAAASGDDEPVDPATRRPDSDPATRRLDSVPPDPDPDDEPERRPAAVAVTRDERGRAPAAPAAPVTQVAAAPLPPAAEDAPPPPRSKGNRLVGTAWVLLAAGLFQVLFFAANALVALVFGGTAAVVPQLQSIAGTALAWLPVLLFFLLFELTVLLISRAGRFAFVFTSLIVGAAVYIATVLLFSLIVRHTLGDANTLAQTFLNWEFILIGLVARETMLWTGLAIGSRGIRVRRRNREERKRYETELADARA